MLRVQSVQAHEFRLVPHIYFRNRYFDPHLALILSADQQHMHTLVVRRQEAVRSYLIGGRVHLNVSGTCDGAPLTIVVVEKVQQRIVCNAARLGARPFVGQIDTFSRVDADGVDADDCANDVVVFEILLIVPLGAAQVQPRRMFSYQLARPAQVKCRSRKPRLDIEALVPQLTREAHSHHEVSCGVEVGGVPFPFWIAVDVEHVEQPRAAMTPLVLTKIGNKCLLNKFWSY